MDNLMEFHWWYVPVGFILLFMVFGKRKGGIVVKSFTANMEILDERFQDCRPEADYSIFEEGKPHHIDIEIDNLPVPVGEELEFQLNGERLAMVKVKRNKEAEFDHWSDENIDFPVLQEGDELVVKYRDVEALKGIFRLK